MSDYKVSKFNYCVDCDGKTVIFNSLRNTFAIMDKSFYEGLDCGNFSNIPQDVVEKLEDKGIVCGTDYDEDKKALIKYMDTIDSGYVEFIILPTLMCNFRCPYCYEERVNGVMSDEVIDRVVKFAKTVVPSSKGLHVSWFGGEPLVAMSVIEKLSERLMKLARAYKKSYTASMTTNGYLLDYDTFMKLFRKYHVTSYQITLDGRAQFHNKTRPLAGGGPTYEVIMKNLIDIKTKCPSPVFSILLRSNLTKETAEDLEAQVAELEQNFGGDNRFSFLFKAVGNWGGDTVRSIEGSLINIEEEFIDRVTALNTTLNITGRYQFFENLNICYAAKKGTYTIDPLGKMLRCTVNLYSEYNILGELDENGEIDKNEKYYDRWQYPANPPARPDSKCEGCGLYANCYGILCPVNTVAANKNVACKKKDAELQGLYKSKPELFAEIGV
ncbi:MAG: radical SAM protein [Ruminococcus flavefaciens]|nr:radical SAM protein [Ruminococcus flavefaciens]